ncbi:MAG: hemerythrin family protein, partial [Halopseudomonas sp.]
AFKLEDNEKILAMLLDQLQEYTTSHFRQEEKLQIKIKYPGYLEHKLEHQRILDNMAELRLRLFEAPQKSTEGEAPEMSAELKDSLGAEMSGALEDYDPDTSGSPLTDPAFQKDVVVLLRNWILDHVLKTDMKMKKLLARFPSNYA